MPEFLSPTVAAQLAVFVLVFAVLAGRILAPRRQQKWSPRHGPAYPSRAPLSVVPTPRHDPTPSIDVAEQLRAVMAAEFTARHVLSRTEAKVMAAAEAAIAEGGLPWRVMAQVSLGEVLASPSKAAFNAINAKRVDLLVVSQQSRPLAAIEYQGQGHYQGTAPARDAIKKEALRRAGVGYIEITFEHGPADVRREIARLAIKHGHNPPELV